MELLGLRVRMERGVPDPEEQKEVERRIKELERELKLD